MMQLFFCQSIQYTEMRKIISVISSDLFKLTERSRFVQVMVAMRKVTPWPVDDVHTHMKRCHSSFAQPFNDDPTHVEEVL